jgi:hypothetical protein
MPCREWGDGADRSPHAREPRQRIGTTVRNLELVQVSLRVASPESPQRLMRRSIPHRSDRRNTMSPTDNDNEPVPWMQQLLDNPFLLLFLGVLIPMVLYTLWGVIDILTIPLAK